MKVVCVGQPKTGTKSIAELFNLLNLKTNSNPICLNINDDYIILDNNYKYYINSDTNNDTNNDINNDINNDTNNDINDFISFFDAFHDYPYSFNYEHIYNLYPDSKFILTIRNSETWFNSFLTYQYIQGATNYKLLNKLYGNSIFSLENKDEVINKYNTYNNNIINFFKNKSNLLIINICDNINKEDYILNEIKEFLSVDIDSSIKLPHMNKQK
jgi:hypothetical protein